MVATRRITLRFMETKKDNKYHVFQFHEVKTFAESLYSQHFNKNKH